MLAFKVLITAVNFLQMVWVTYTTYILTTQAVKNPGSSKSIIFYGRETSNSLVLSILNFFYIVSWPITYHLPGKLCRIVWFLGLDFTIYYMLLLAYCSYKPIQETNKMHLCLAGSNVHKVRPRLPQYVAKCTFLFIACLMFSFQLVALLNPWHYRLSIGVGFYRNGRRANIRSPGRQVLCEERELGVSDLVLSLPFVILHFHLRFF